MTDRKPITDEDLEQLDAWLDDWRKCEISAESVAIVMEQYLPGLIAELREAREALGELLACENMLLLLKMAKKPEPGKYKEWAERHVEATRRAARILKEASDGHV